MKLFLDQFYVLMRRFRIIVHALAYNIFNWFKRMALPVKMRKQQIDTIRLKLLKIAAKALHSARYITFKLCSSCPYKSEFYETLEKHPQVTAAAGMTSNREP